MLMQIEFPCPNCSYPILAEVDVEPSMVKCHDCGRVFALQITVEVNEVKPNVDSNVVPLRLHGSATRN